jgi:hypothetical protein
MLLQAGIAFVFGWRFLGWCKYEYMRRAALHDACMIISIRHCFMYVTLKQGIELIEQQTAKEPRLGAMVIAFSSRCGTLLINKTGQGTQKRLLVNRYIFFFGR